MNYDFPVKNILVPTDFSEQANNAVYLAYDLAKDCNAEITLLTVFDYPGGSAFKTMAVDPKNPMSSPYIKEMMEEIKTRIKELPADIDSNEVKITKKVQIGNPFTHISDEISQNDVDLVIMGTRGISGLEEILIGSNTERVVRHSKCPVITVKEKVSKNSINDIIFATSLDEDNLDLVNKLKQLQDLFQATVHFVRINTPNDFKRDRTTLKMMNDFIKKYLFKDYTVSIYNDITEEEGMIYYAEEKDADMIALGTHGRKGLSHLIGGSIAEDLVNHAKRPVWTYRIKK